MNTKIKWLLDNGFEENYCEFRKNRVYEYKGYSWAEDY